MANEIYSIKVGSTTHPIALGNSDWYIQYGSNNSITMLGETLCISLANNLTDAEEGEAGAAFYQYVDSDGNLLVSNENGYSAGMTFKTSDGFFVTSSYGAINLNTSTDLILYGSTSASLSTGSTMTVSGYSGLNLRSAVGTVDIEGQYGVVINADSHTVQISGSALNIGVSNSTIALSAYLSGSTINYYTYLTIGSGSVQNPSSANTCLNIGYSNTMRLGSSGKTTGVTFIGAFNTVTGNTLYNRNGLLVAGNYCKIASPTSTVSGVTVYGYAAHIQTQSRQVYIGCGYSSSYTKNAISIAKASSSTSNPTVYLNASANTGGAGLAEMYEWVDGNPESESRYGRFVTTVGEKIRFATPEDNYVLGAVDPHPYIVGDCPTEEWHKRYLTDVFGKIIEDEVLNEETGEIELVGRENPEWDPDREYVTRDLRYEYSPITSKGKVVLIDDGTCVVDGFATVGEGGIATRSDDNVSVRVLKRIDDTHIRVYIDSAFLIRH